MRWAQLSSLILVLLVMNSSAVAQVLVEEGSSMEYLVNDSDPGIGLDWIDTDFDDSTWTTGTYGIGYDDDGDADDILTTIVPSGTRSVYTRVVFNIDDPDDVENLFVGFDYDDACIAWVNGVEVFRSDNFDDPGDPAWDADTSNHESSNWVEPDYGQLTNASDAIESLVAGDNVFAVGVWNRSTSSDDLVLIPYLEMNLSQRIERGPYLQCMTEDQVTVRWRTLFAAESHISYGILVEDLSESAASTAITREHEITLSDLDAATKYFYSVSDENDLLAGEDDDHFFVTNPETGSAQGFRVWVLGDSGTANTDAEDVRDAYYTFTGMTHTDLWVMLGDNAYDDGTDEEYQRAVFRMYSEMLRKSPLWPAFGNHDDNSSTSLDQSGPYFDMFTLPTDGVAGGEPSGTEAYYSFDYGNVHFIVLDSADTDLSASSEMWDWLEDDLAATTSQLWTLAYWHHPPYTKGSHDSDDEDDLIDMRENALPILEAAGVDLVLCGHSHSYERSFLLDGHYDDSATLNNSMKLDDGDGREDGDGAYEKPTAARAANEGAVYITAGSSGKIDSGDLDHPAMYYSAEVLGSAVLDFDGNRIDATFIDKNGDIEDYFTMIKGIQQFVRGDTNADGVLDLSDAIGTLIVLFLDGVSTCDDAHDGNDDDTLDLEDPLELLARLFSGGAPLPAPARCGPDPTSGTLTCEEFASCE